MPELKFIRTHRNTYLEDRHTYRLSKQVSPSVQGTVRLQFYSYATFPGSQVKCLRLIIGQRVPFSEKWLIVTKHQHLRIELQIERVPYRIFTNVSQGIFPIWQKHHEPDGKRGIDPSGDHRKLIHVLLCSENNDV